MALEREMPVDSKSINRIYARWCWPMVFVGDAAMKPSPPPVRAERGAAAGLRMAWSRRKLAEPASLLTTSCIARLCGSREMARRACSILHAKLTSQHFASGDNLRHFREEMKHAHNKLVAAHV